MSAAGGEPRKVCPQGCTIAYASPQQLLARQLILEWSAQADMEPSDAGGSHSTAQDSQGCKEVPVRRNKLRQRLSSFWRRVMCGGKGSAVLQDEQDEEDDSLIDGPETVVFSAGVVLYEMVSYHA